MRRWRTITALLLCLILAGVTACNPFGSDEEETSQQLVEVMRGDLTVTVSGSGNIEVSNEANLAFGIGGRIDKIYVEENDKVSEGDVLAKLETDALEVALSQAKVGQPQAQVAVTTAQLAVTQAQVALNEAEYNLEELKRLHVSYELQRIAKLQIKAAELQLEEAEQSIELAQQSLELAQQSLELAQKQLDEATLIAPFDGMVASVDADEGDTVLTTTTIIHLIDLASMELNAEVDEIDIPEVKLRQRAIIEIDALPALQLEGEVTSISSLATEEGGVVLYEVTIGFNVPEGSGLRVGMSATADIVIDERSNVLLVPDRAVKQDSEGNPIVEVMVNEQIEERAVVTSISDGFQTEIVDGLEEGEVVIERRAR